MHSFETDIAAKEFVRERVDMPVTDTVELVGEGIVLHTFTQELEEGTFTNIYDLSFPAGSVRPDIVVPDELTSVFDYVEANPDVRAATGGGFFFLADQASVAPRQLGLNLVLVDGQMRSFPVADREAVLTDGERLSAKHIQALGVLSVITQS